MNDLETRARRAGEELRRVAAARVPTPPMAAASRAPRRGQVWAVAGLATVVVLAILVASPGVRVPVVDTGPALGPGDVTEPVATDGELPVPPVGEALPAYLADGTPVFVSRPEETEVVVVGAVDGHEPFLASKLVAYCRSSRWFEEPRHGSRYNGWGDWAGGPSPTGLDDHAVEVIADGQRVRLTGEVTRERSRRDLPAEQPQQGPSCFEDPPRPVHTIAHVPPTERSATDGHDVPGDRWVWADLVVGDTTQGPVVCAVDGTCPADAPAIATPDGWVRPDRVAEPAMITALARRTAAGIRLLLPADEAVPAALERHRPVAAPDPAAHPAGRAR